MKSAQKYLFVFLMAVISATILLSWHPRDAFPPKAIQKLTPNISAPETKTPTLDRGG